MKLIIVYSLDYTILRYKCIALNKAGNASFEYLVGVNGGGGGASSKVGLPAQSMQAGSSYSTLFGGSSRDLSAGAGIRTSVASSSQTNLQHHMRDQRAQQQQVVSAQMSQEEQQAIAAANKLKQSLNNKQPASFQPASANQQQQTTQTNLVPSNTWLKSSATFQITIVVVSVLMAAVIVAFLLFCIVIYQIKPSSIQTILLPNVQSPARGSGGLFSSMVISGRQKSVAETNSIVGMHQTRPIDAQVTHPTTNNSLISETPFCTTNEPQNLLKTMPIIAPWSFPLTLSPPIGDMHLVQSANRSPQTLQRLETTDEEAASFAPQQQQFHQLQPRIEPSVARLATSHKYPVNSSKPGYKLYSLYKNGWGGT